jgi:hypothetical protein
MKAIIFAARYGMSHAKIAEQFQKPVEWVRDLLCGAYPRWDELCETARERAIECGQRVLTWYEQHRVEVPVWKAEDFPLYGTNPNSFVSSLITRANSAGYHDSVRAVPRLRRCA